jgi:creatinine amidohydrolase
LASWEEVDHQLQDGGGKLALPVGSTEQHGPGPLGTDFIIACAIAREAANRGPLTVAPPVCYGYSDIHSAFPGTITVSPQTMTSFVYEIIQQAHKQGFATFAIVNGHGSNAVWLEPLALKVRDMFNDVRLLTFEWWKEPSVQAYEREKFGDENGQHANCSEFSILAHLFPETPPPPPVHDRRPWDAGESLRPEEFRSLHPTGVVGANLAHVSARHGAELLRLAATSLLSEVERAGRP